MVMRQLGSDAAERLNNIEESVTLAKNAVQLDITDGTSWCKYYSRISSYFIVLLVVVVMVVAIRLF